MLSTKPFKAIPLLTIIKHFVFISMSVKVKDLIGLVSIIVDISSAIYLSIILSPKSIEFRKTHSFFKNFKNNKK